MMKFFFAEIVTEEWVNGVVFHDWKRGVLTGLKTGTPYVWARWWTNLHSYTLMLSIHKNLGGDLHDRVRSFTEMGKCTWVVQKVHKCSWHNR